MVAKWLVFITVISVFVNITFGCDFAPIVKTERLIFGRPLNGFVPKPPPQPAANGVTTGWFTQKLDHFDSSVATTWQQVPCLHLLISVSIN